MAHATHKKLRCVTLSRFSQKERENGHEVTHAIQCSNAAHIRLQWGNSFLLAWGGALLFQGGKEVAHEINEQLPTHLREQKEKAETAGRNKRSKTTETSELTDRLQCEIGSLVAFVIEWKSAHRATEGNRCIPSAEERKQEEGNSNVQTLTTEELFGRKLLSEFKDATIRRISAEMPSCSGKATKFGVKP